MDAIPELLGPCGGPRKRTVSYAQGTPVAHNLSLPDTLSDTDTPRVDTAPAGLAGCGGALCQAFSVQRFHDTLERT